ncbi:MAG: TonB-dependent receptor family protein [Bacteroidales bacterium]|nr:TonB-dependent receptor family protein [Bacteroidales bacterium]
MKQLSFLILFYLFSVFSASLFAQRSADERITLVGSVVDSLSGKSVEYPTVTLFTDSLKLVRAVAGAADGRFTIEAPEKGSYFIYVSQIGYVNTRKEIHIDGMQRRVDLGKVEIREGENMLREVTITAVRPLIRNEVDKLTYNLEADPQTATSTVLDILRKVPMLSVDGDDNVRLNGETNYKVLMNGRSTGMIVRNFKDVIKSMPASSIKSIEVITNPPVRYDSEGIGGIINIITHSRPSGYNGSLNLGTNTLGGFNGGGYIAAQAGKFAISSNLHAGKFVSRRSTSASETENFVSEEYRYSSSHGESKNQSMFYRFGIEASYEIDTLNLLTLSGWGYLGNSLGVGSSFFEARNMNNQLTRKYARTSDSKNIFGSGSGSVSYQRTYKKPDQNLTFSYSLDVSPEKQDATTIIEPELNYLSYSQRSINNAMGYEHTAQVDYYDPLSNTHQIETGLKYILRQSISNTEVKLYNELTDEWVLDMSRVNDLDYNQHIAHVYGGYVFKKKVVTARAGFRGEYAFNDGLSKSAQGDKEFDNRQFNLVPYVNFTFMLNKGHMLTVGYTQRLNRPGIWFLNPYVNDVDPMNISYGNPNLNTVVRNAFSVGHRKSSQKWNLGVNLGAFFTTNNIERISRMDAEGVRHSTYENIGKNQRYQLNVNFSYRQGQKLNVYLNGGSSYVHVSYSESDMSNSGLGFNGSLGCNLMLWKGSTMYANAFVFGGDISLQSRNPYMYRTNFGMNQRFLKDKLTISLGITDPFRSKDTYRIDYLDSTFKSHVEFTQYVRSANVGASWRFGTFNANVRKARKSSSDDRMEGGNSTPNR